MEPTKPSALPAKQSHLYLWEGHSLYSAFPSTHKQPDVPLLLRAAIFGAQVDVIIIGPSDHICAKFRNGALPEAVVQPACCVPCTDVYFVCSCFQIVYSYLHVSVDSTEKVTACVCGCTCSWTCVCCVRDDISPWVLRWSQHLWINYPEGTYLPFQHRQASDTQTHSRGFKMSQHLSCQIILQFPAKEVHTATQRAAATTAKTASSSSPRTDLLQKAKRSLRSVSVSP